MTGVVRWLRRIEHAMFESHDWYWFGSGFVHCVSCGKFIDFSLKREGYLRSE